VTRPFANKKQNYKKTLAEFLCFTSAAAQAPGALRSIRTKAQRHHRGLWISAFAIGDFERGAFGRLVFSGALLP
jgi:hypothetical protein